MKSLKEIARRVKSDSDTVIAWRRELHSFPELSHQEKRTSAFVGRQLEQLGFRNIQTGVGGYGVIAEIDGGRPGKMVGIRADMDGLPIQERVDCEFASRNPGVMHACGHDAHTAMLLGAARVLKELAAEDGFPGKVRLIFQPAEEKTDAEGKSGGRRMVEAGVMEGVSMVVGQHVSPLMETGKLAFQRGIATANSDSFELVIRGRGAHGARPQDGVDPIVISAAVIQAAQQLVSRVIPPTETAVVTIGSIHGGTAANIIPEEVVLKGTIRTFNEPVRRVLFDELRRLVGIAEAMRGAAELKIVEGYPACLNDEEVTGLAEEAVREALGDEAIHPPLGASTGAEDFAFMSRRAPGTFLRLGVKDPAWPAALPVHTPTFQLDEKSLVFGTTALVATAAEYLRRHEPR